MSISAGQLSETTKGPLSIKEILRASKLTRLIPGSSISMQYSFKSSSFFPSKFLVPVPQFQPQMDLSVRNLPCVLFLHGTFPGGFDVSRWMAAGLAQSHNIWDPISRYSALNLFNVDYTESTSYGSKNNDNLENDQSKFESDQSKQTNHGYDNMSIYHRPPLGILNISRPGYLESSLTIEDTFMSEALAIIRLINGLSIRSVRIVAHGTSALLAMELASLLQFRDKVRSIVLIDPLLSSSSKLLDRIDTPLSHMPSFIKNWYYYGWAKQGMDSPQFRNFVSEVCGPLGTEEMFSDLGLSTLYKHLGVLFSRNENRKSGIKSDYIKLESFTKNESEVKQQWNLVKAPILCISTSSTIEEYKSNEFNNQSLVLEEERRAALLNTQSKTQKFERVIGGGRLLYPLGEVSNRVLEFLNQYGSIH
ncbi:hypothetical protein BB559_002990 [Furculomyces boomerangus]|uniref:AB hydrolase-1 domain-containing protein n=2 Tax=Harpellales TaxID=61421 RepID=A0A2T9YQB8_9FUNG|nr:hypothetical protein BB559_002990 [Furculomyces boomerangus]PVZ99054.1 hypothetical protein BB558_004931 [Smittium angustum]